MSVTEMNLALDQENLLINNRLLGALAVAFAPMLLVFFIFGSIDAAAPKTLKDQILSLTGILYILGWMAGITGMRRFRAIGDGAGAKAIFIIQMTLLSFAMLFSVMEFLGFTYENGGWLFAVADAGYPLSHLFMIITGIFAWRAGVFRGLSLIAPFMVGFALPLSLAFSWVAGMKIGIFGFGSLTALGLGTIGYAIYKKSKIYSAFFSQLKSISS